MAYLSPRVVVTLFVTIAFLAGVPRAVATARPAPPRPSSQSAQYYVANNGNDSNPGSALHPFRTLRKGVSVLTPGATLYVKRGTYSEALNRIPGGRSWSQPVVIAAYPGHEVVVKPPHAAREVKSQIPIPVVGGLYATPRLGPITIARDETLRVVNRNALDQQSGEEVHP
jgi:hypothetical protein